MVRIILGVMLIILVAAVLGIDQCTCGNGPTIRSNLKSLFHGSMKEESNKTK